MDHAELESLTTAVLSRIAGNARQPQGGLAQGSGVAVPADLTNPDPIKARAARRAYCQELSGAGLERCSKTEREVYFAEARQVLADDGYFI